jgi:putative ABC transport system permease protein
MNELHSALRRLRRQPAFSMLVIGVLALGIGGTTAIFSVVDGVLLRPLPFPAADRLITLAETQPNVKNASLSGPDFVDLREKISDFGNASSFLGRSVNATFGDKPERFSAAQTDGAWFDTLRPHLQAGRGYSRGEAHEVVLTAAIANRLFAGKAVGHTVTLDGEPYTVVGVVDQEARFPLWAELWMLSIDEPPRLPGNEVERGNHYLRGLARLKPGVSLKQAGAQLDGLSAALEQAYPNTNRGHRFSFETLEENLFGNVRTSIWMLFAAVMAVLLVACVNVANLMLGRAVARRRELATRAALGASRRQLLQHLLAETVLLALPGGALGVVLAWIVAPALAQAQRLPRAADLRLDLAVLAFAFTAAVAAGFASGLAPALVAARANQMDVLRDSMPSGRHRLRTALVVAEVALSCALLASSTLLGRSFEKLASVDPGFDAARAVTVRISRPPDGEFKAFFPELVRRVSALPGVKAAGAILNLPYSGNNRNGSVIIEGRAPPSPNDQISEFQVVAGDYFGAMGVKLRDGRLLRDDEPTPVVVVNEAFARKYFPAGRLLGQRVRHDGGDVNYEIVGVVGDVHQQSLAEPVRAEWYAPFQQLPERAMALVVRGNGLLMKEVAAEVAALDPQQSIYAVQPLEAVLSGSLAQRRVALSLLGVFSAAALILSALGLYGVISLSVEQRRREIGVRMALGADRAGVIRLVIGQGMRAAAVGVALGAAMALALAPLLRSLLYGVGAIDPVSLASSALVLAAAALIACWLPARRASATDPAIALRAE